VRGGEGIREGERVRWRSPKKRDGEGVSPSKGASLPQAQAGYIICHFALLPNLTFIPERLSEEEPLKATPIGSISSLRRLLSPGDSILFRPTRGATFSQSHPAPPHPPLPLWELVDKI
jgi:hypothetical protein